MSWKRSERLIDMTNYLLNHPKSLIPLTFFSERYDAAKSSISEDIAILKDTFELQGIGKLVTIPGAAGGVKYFVKVNDEQVKPFIEELCQLFASPDRLLPGGYLYMADIVGDPKIMDRVGRVFASRFSNQQIDAVMTVATKGIPLAYATARYLNVPVVIVRKDNKITEGSTVSINYVSGSSKRIQSMLLAKRSLQEGSRVLIVDDFMKAGGTINGMISLLEEFNASFAGIAVLVEAEDIENRLVDQYISMVKLSNVDINEKKIEVQQGNYFDTLEAE
ncbi:pur operon repressor [Caldibacillus lycopersici]|uniref:Pur operon repressor n=1 Tax=Perspicuibacillus lycopersici TaxID=1325689 RepID=A0AAE3IVM8_9BACI|nr:pur operon repressor [Perspicuibacillus lycopersici]MCU9615292.1 pur operon repressor [Perspicuibacillus lycopersici]